jgi:hypothetical protein
MIWLPLRLKLELRIPAKNEDIVGRSWIQDFVSEAQGGEEVIPGTAKLLMMHHADMVTWLVHTFCA